MPDQLIGRRTALKYFGMLATLPAAQEFLKKWLTKASAASNPQAGHGLHAPPADRETLLTEMSSPERDHTAQHPGFAFYRLIKSMTVEGFYTSRVGLIDVLGYKGLDALSEFPGCTHPEHQT